MKKLTFTLLLLLLFQTVFAHDLDLTLIKVLRQNGQTVIQLTTPLSRFVKTSSLGAQPSGPALDRSVRERLQVKTDSSSDVQVDTQADLLIWTAKVPTNVQLKWNRFDESTSAARTIIANYEEGKLKSEKILDAQKPQTTALGMAQTGVLHILTGWDHLLFVVGLALLGSGWKTIIKVLTAFTVAHSITLTIATLGWIHSNPRIVEPLIALSIVALALEGIYNRDSNSKGRDWTRIGIAFAFGLVHGLGFAGGLSELGMSGGQLFQNLLSFSLGIELAQLSIILPTLALTSLLAKAATEPARKFSLASSVLLGMIGCFWFMERIL